MPKPVYPNISDVDALLTKVEPLINEATLFKREAYNYLVEYLEDKGKGVIFNPSHEGIRLAWLCVEILEDHLSNST